MRRSNKIYGFTLLETILYIGIIAIVLIAVVGLLLSFSGIVSEVKNMRRLTTGADTALDNMVSEIRASVSIVTTSSVFDIHPGTLVAQGTTSVTTFSVVGGRLQMQKGGIQSYITPNDVIVENFVVRFATSSVSQMVKIELSLGTGSSNMYMNRNFYTAAVLRGSY